MTLSDERLREIIGAGVPCVPATGADVAAMARELLSRRASPHQGEAGVTCERCHKPVEYDLIVSDDVWACISPRPVEGFKGGGVLCPDCIVDALIALYASPPQREGLEEARAAVTVEGVDYAPAKEWLRVPDYFVLAVNEFLSDWKNGDFSLSTLAALDAGGIATAKERWAAELEQAAQTGGEK